jgi:hypothetical protein
MEKEQVDKTLEEADAYFDAMVANEDVMKVCLATLPNEGLKEDFDAQLARIPALVESMKKRDDLWSL